MTGGGGKPRRGKMQLGSGQPKGTVATKAADEGRPVTALEADVGKLQKVMLIGLICSSGALHNHQLLHRTPCLARSRLHQTRVALASQPQSSISATFSNCCVHVRRS